MPPRMHADEFAIDARLVAGLLTARFPQWARLPILPVPSAGTDHALYRLGSDMVVRLPRLARVAEQVEREQRWLPQLAPLLPVAVPVPLGRGAPTEDYPWPWSVYRWLEGETPSAARLSVPDRLAADLAAFVDALHRIDLPHGPAPGPGNFFRGVPLATRDAITRKAIAELGENIDADAASRAWQTALEAPVHDGRPVWIHGDLAPGNLLCEQGRLAAVIDFGGLAVGDPACDLIVAWNLLPPAARAIFRQRLAPDDAAWARGRGWALSIALVQLPYYRDTNPTLATEARQVIAQVLAEAHRTG